MSGYIGNIPTPQATQTRNVYTATAGQTTFGTAGYTPGFLDVYLNGVHLVNGTDYTASNGSEVVLTTGAAAGDNLEVVAYTTFSLSDNTFPSGLTVDNANATVLTVDRATSDGTIIDLQKDGSSVGSVGTNGSTLYIGSTEGTDAYIGFGNDIVRPVTSSGASRDNAIDLGYTGMRFRNLYLSGGVYLGGTGAANLLNDVERGTFTPTLSTSNFTNTGLINVACSYFKVGTMVHLQMQFDFGGVSGNWAVGDYFELAGLPFAAENSSGASKYYSNVFNASSSFASNARSTFFNLTTGTGTLTICEYANSVSRVAGLLGTISYSTLD